MGSPTSTRLRAAAPAGHRNLTGFVDEQIVELLVVLGPCEEPSRSGHQGIGCQARIVIVGGHRDGRICDSGLAVGNLLDGLQRDLLLACPSRDRGQEIADRLVRVGGDGDALAVAEKSHDRL
jgi:hypothetical protein